MCIQRLHTLAGNNEACHAVRYTCASSQESDSHDVIWNIKRVADDGYLKGIKNTPHNDKNHHNGPTNGMKKKKKSKDWDI